MFFTGMGKTVILHDKANKPCIQGKKHTLNQEAITKPLQRIRKRYKTSNFFRTMATIKE